MSEPTEASIGGVNSGSFTSGDNNDPMILDFANIDAYSTNYTSQGRHALYRVGGTSAFFKRLDNLFFDTDLQVATTLTGSTLTVALTGAKNDFNTRSGGIVLEKHIALVVQILLSLTPTLEKASLEKLTTETQAHRH